MALKLRASFSNRVGTGEEILYQMPHLIEMRVKFWIWFFAVGFAGNHRIHPFCSRLFTNIFRVISFISNEVLSTLYFRNNLGGRFGVVYFTPSDFKIDRISMRIGGHVNFGCRSSSRLSNGAFFSKPSSTRMLVSADVTSVGEYPLRINLAS